MIFTCLQENLEKGLGIVSKAVPAKSSLPILSNVLISTENGRLKLAASNLETTISTYVGASIDKEGTITIPAKILKEFISNLSQSTLTGHLTNETLNLSSEKTKSKFNGTSSADYPELPVLPKDAKYLELNPQIFSSAILSVAFAASNDDSRPVFTGVLLSYKDGKLTIAASDGFRLSEHTIPASGTLEEVSTIIPAKTLMEIARIFGGAIEPVKFALNENENLAVFECEDTLVATRILDGQYPDYKRIIPTTSSVSAEFFTQELLEAVRLTNVFSKEQNNVIRLKIDPEGKIHVISSAQETGENQSQVNAEVEGSKLDMAFNSKYLLDFLTNAKGEKITLKANTATSPCIFKPTAEENFVHIVMPMQIQ